MDLTKIMMFDTVECNKCNQKNFSTRYAFSEMMNACPNCKNVNGLYLKTLSYIDMTKFVPPRVFNKYEPVEFSLETDGYEGFLHSGDEDFESEDDILDFYDPMA